MSSTYSPRARLTITGQDATTFLQNIISNDVTLLDTQPGLRACLLTPQGKYLHDFFVTREGSSYLLDCEGGIRGEDLMRRLSLYKLRADVSFTLADRPIAADAPPFAEWDAARIRTGLPDGARDAEIGVSTLAELNLDKIAVSYTKGCYVGQELVARMHNRNLGKKHLVPVEFYDTPPSSGTDIDGFGVMRSSCGMLGLILMPRDIEDTLKQGQDLHAPFRLLGL